MNFLILNGVVVTLVVISILATRRGRKKPVQLDMRARTESKDEKAAQPFALQAGETNRRPPGWDNYHPRPRPNVDEAVGQPALEKDLNVLFNWNGHTWSAYEVLGLPAGCSREVVHAAYQRARAKADPQSLPFLKAAYDAILKS